MVANFLSIQFYINMIEEHGKFEMKVNFLCIQFYINTTSSSYETYVVTLIVVITFTGEIDFLST